MIVRKESFEHTLLEQMVNGKEASVAVSRKLCNPDLHSAPEV